VVVFVIFLFILDFTLLSFVILHFCFCFLVEVGFLAYLRLYKPPNEAYLRLYKPPNEADLIIIILKKKNL
jgi:hypothetical protein